MMSAKRRRAASSPMFGKAQMNSSPPKRTIASYGRSFVRIISATRRSRTSPATCPSESFSAFRLLTSTKARTRGLPVRRERSISCSTWVRPIPRRLTPVSWSIPASLRSRTASARSRAASARSFDASARSRAACSRSTATSAHSSPAQSSPAARCAVPHRLAFVTNPAPTSAPSPASIQLCPDRTVPRTPCRRSSGAAANGRPKRVLQMRPTAIRRRARPLTDARRSPRRRRAARSRPGTGRGGRTAG